MAKGKMNKKTQEHYSGNFSGHNSKMELKICERGFFITDSDSVVVPSWLEQWDLYRIAGMLFYVHPNQTLFFVEYEGDTFFLIGHAFNPFTSEIDEEEILKVIARKKKCDEEHLFDYINSITGVFVLGMISDNHITVLLDCAGMMAGYYGLVEDVLIITSHSVIPAVIFGLQRTEYVERLLKYKFYKLYGKYLPGDISPYQEIKRIVPNTFIEIDNKWKKIRVERFFPRAALNLITSEAEYQKQLCEITKILESTMAQIAKKWQKPAISLTGGMDSKTTLSAAKGCYNAFQYFSYVTTKAESVDADAAHIICGAMNLNHRRYDIAVDPSSYEDFDDVKAILAFNNDFLGSTNINDICKRIYFAENDDFDVEVKSWVSEIARANYYKKFEKKQMPRDITPRRCSTMYKIFLHDRKLLRETDYIFDEYIRKTSLDDQLYNYDWSDLFLWEIRYGSWGGLVITSEHKYSYDITVPYNNRKLLQMMLAVPLEKRKKDDLHRDLINSMNPDVDAVGITITNLNETKFRAFCEKWYFNINSILPF